MAQTAPPPEVLDAFGSAAIPAPLAGGQGESYRSGGIVLKRVSLEAEAVWTARVYSRLHGDGFRVPAPVRTRSGAWVHSGWCAFEYIEAEPAGPDGGRWPETLDASRAFHRALQGEPRPPFFDTRTDAWAEADRLAFGERELEPLPLFREPIGRLQRLLRPIDAPAQVIHGDFTANVLFAAGQPPCVIDFSPYWRPAEFALAVVVSDAISWTGADPEIIGLCDDVPRFDQWLARATLRRVWENDQHARRGRVGAEAFLAEYLPMIELLERRAAGR